METQNTLELSAVKADILKNLDQAAMLEKLYRDDKALFKMEFNLIYHQIKDSKSAQFWHERLNYENDVLSWGTYKELLFVLLAIIVSGLIAKIPHFTGISEDYFYPRNLGFVVFPTLTFYLSWKNRVSVKNLVMVFLSILIFAVYINLLPNNIPSDTLVLACIHLPVVLWFVLFYTFTGTNYGDYQKRLSFLRFNGELLVISAILFICCGLLTGVGFGLFKLIGISIELFFDKYILVFGLPAVPILGAYLVLFNPQLVKMISPIVAKVFTPLVLVMLIVYLTAVMYTGKDPYNNRDFLLIFNVLLLGVLALIFFSISTDIKSTQSQIGKYLLLSLSVVTVILNGIALAAILFRISEWGWTPNRTAVLGSNLLILTNLILILFQLLKCVRKNENYEQLGKSMATYLPVYLVWAMLVTLLFPLLFHFK